MNIKWLFLLTSVLFVLNNAMFAGKVNAQRGSDPPIRLGAYYFDGWTGIDQGFTHITDALVNDFPEREPIWGWVTSTQPIMNAQIDAAANAGIDFFSFDWYYRDGSAKLALNQALGLYLASPNKTRLAFCLMVANHEPFLTGPENWPALIKEWIKLFKDPSYLKVDEKPFLIFFSTSSLIEQFGSAAAVHKALDLLKRAARREGLRGVTVAACVGPSEVEEAQSCGFDLLTGYNYHTVGFVENQIEHPIENLLRSERRIWDQIKDRSSLPYIPVATLNWDPRPWSDDPFTVPRYTGYSLNSVYNTVMSLRQWISSNTDQTSKEQIALLYAWNENAEGGWLTPSKLLGDSLLQGVKKALTEKIIDN